MIERLSGLESRLRLALRAMHPAPAGSRDRVRTRLAASIAALDAACESSGEGGLRKAADGTGTNPAPASNGIGYGAFGAGKRVALGLLGGVAGAALLAAVGARKPVQVVYVDRPAAQPSAILPAAQPSAILPAAAPAVPPGSPLSSAGDLLATSDGHGSPSEATPAGAASRGMRGDGASSSTFAAERILLDQARTALVQGDPQHALLVLGRHRARFAHGLLAEEREAMRVEALVGASRYAEARAAAQAFRARNPRSLFLAAVDSAIASIP